MKNFVLLSVLLSLAAVPAKASDELFIKSIVEAGLNGCSGEAPESLGPRTFRNVQKLCAGRDSCQLAPKSAKKFGCTSLFVIFKCSNGSVHEVSTPISKTLTVQCE
jgi:hypothetical protein